MADIERRVVVIFDRTSAEKVGAQFENTLKEAGQQGGKAFLRSLQTTFNKIESELKELRAAGLIDDKEHKRRLDAAARAYNTSLLKAMDQARVKADLTDKEYIKLTRTLKKVGDEGTKSAGLLERGFGKVVGVLGGLFLANRIKNFGIDAVKAATEADVVWNRLAGTLDNAGVRFADVQADIDGAADAMQRATTVGDEEFAEVLQTLIGITNDYQSSLDNVQLVADLAAAKQIDLGTAASLVGKVMVGETGTLKRYGIVVQEGSDALEIMRQRFAGMAENEVKTFGGQLKQLNNAWGEFKEAVGEALIEAGGGTSVMQTLTTAIRIMQTWVEKNKDTFADFASGLTGVVIPAVSIFLKIVKAIGDVFTGVWFIIMGAVVKSVANIADAYGLATLAASKFLGLFSKTKAADLEAHSKSVRDHAAALREWAEAAVEVGKESVTGIFAGGDDGVTPPRTTLPRGTSRPSPGTGAGAGKPGQPLAIAGVTAVAQSSEVPQAVVVPIALDTTAITEVEPIMVSAADRIQTAWTNAADIIADSFENRVSVVAGALEALATGGIKGLAKYASAKAKEALALAAGATARGLIALASPVSSALLGEKPGVHFAAAAKFLAEAALWKGLGAATGGGGGGGAGGGAPSVGAANTGAAREAQPKSELHITFVGEGFEAVNPKVQQVVMGAIQEGSRRVGPNGKVRVYQRRA